LSQRDELFYFAFANDDIVNCNKTE